MRRLLFAICASLLFLTPAAVGARDRTQAVRAFVVTVIHAGQRPEPVLDLGKWGYVAIGYEHSGDVVVVDERSNRVVATIPTGHEVEELAFDDFHYTLYSANRTSNTVSVIEIGGLKRRTNISIAGGPNGLAVDDISRRLYVSLGKGKRIAVVDTLSNRVVQTMNLLAGPEAIGVDPIAHRLFVGFPKLNEVMAFDERTLSKLATIRVGLHPVHPMAVDPQDHRVYVVNEGSSTVSIINSRSLRVVRNIRAGRWPEGIALDVPGHRAFVSDEGDPGTDKNSGHSISILDLRSGRISGTIRTPLGPDGIAYVPGNSSLYVAGENQGGVSVIKLRQ
jgi:YVTN family beta-propeller protein